MNSRYAGQHQPDFSNASHWLLVDVLRKLAVVVLCGLLLLIAGREISSALDDLAPPPGSARGAVDSEAAPTVIGECRFTGACPHQCRRDTIASVARMDYHPKPLAPGGADFGSSLRRNAQQAVSTPTLPGIARGTEHDSRWWIGAVVAGAFLLPLLADVGCGFAAPGKIVVVQQGESHCLWQVGAKGYRYSVDADGRIADPSRGYCQPERRAAEFMAGELNHRLPIEYAECLDRGRDSPLKFSARALVFY